MSRPSSSCDRVPCTVTRSPRSAARLRHASFSGRFPNHQMDMPSALGRGAGFLRARAPLSPTELARVEEVHGARVRVRLFREKAFLVEAAADDMDRIRSMPRRSVMSARCRRKRAMTRSMRRSGAAGTGPAPDTDCAAADWCRDWLSRGACGEPPAAPRPRPSTDGWSG